MGNEENINYHISMDFEPKKTNTLDFIKMLVVSRGASLSRLTKLLHDKKGASECYSGFYAKLKNDTLRFKDVRDIAELLDYEIVFRDKRNSM